MFMVVFCEYVPYYNRLQRFEVKSKASEHTNVLYSIVGFNFASESNINWD